MQSDASPPGVNIGSVVQALRGNSSRTLLPVRNGSDWTFTFDRVLSSGTADPIAEKSERWEGLPDVMSQVVPFEVKNDRRISRVHFVPMWDGNQDMSVALCQAMRTNKTVRALELCLNYGTLEERHLTAIEDSLLKNDTLQSFAFLAGHEFGFPNHLASHETIRDTFERILQWNMCLVETSIRCMRVYCEIQCLGEQTPLPPNSVNVLSRPSVSCKVLQTFLYKLFKRNFWFPS